MSSQTNQQKRVVNIQFCKNCKTHSWCTHHSQQRYHQLFLKLSKAIQSEFPDIIVKGNELPKNLVPIKPSENKFFDAMKGKYVFFPAIGAFQVFIDGQLIFSKKAINSWPIFQDVVDQISLKINGKIREKPINQNDNMTQEDTIALANSYLSKVQNRKTMHKNQHDSFTLSDHFKLYQKGKHNQGSAKDYYAQIQKINQKKFKYQYQNNDSSDSMMIPQSQSRVKDLQLMKKLQSIEQQNFTDELKRLTKGPQQGDIQGWNRYLDHLESKFQKFQQKVTKIEKQNIKRDKISPTLDQTYKGLYKSRSKEEHCYSPTKRAQQKLAEKIGEVNQSYKTFLFDKQRMKKLANIQAFLNASQKQKNKVLKKIYGLGKNQQLPSSIKRRVYKKRNHDFKRSEHPKNSNFDSNLISQSEQDSSQRNSDSQNSQQSENSHAMPKGIKFNNQQKNKFPQQKSQSTNQVGKEKLVSNIKKINKKKQYKVSISRTELKSQKNWNRPIQKEKKYQGKFKSRGAAQSFENNDKFKNDKQTVKYTYSKVPSDQVLRIKKCGQRQIERGQIMSLAVQTRQINLKNKANAPNQKRRYNPQQQCPTLKKERRNKTKQQESQANVNNKNFRSRKTQQNFNKRSQKNNKIGKFEDQKYTKKQQKQAEKSNNLKQKAVIKDFLSKQDPTKMNNSRVIFDQQNHSPLRIKKSHVKQSQKIEFSLSSDEQDFKLMHKYSKQSGLSKQLQLFNKNKEAGSQQYNKGLSNQYENESQASQSSSLLESDKKKLNSYFGQIKQQNNKVNNFNLQKDNNRQNNRNIQQQKSQTAKDFHKNSLMQSDQKRYSRNQSVKQKKILSQQTNLAGKAIRKSKDWKKSETNQKKIVKSDASKNKQQQKNDNKYKQKRQQQQKKSNNIQNTIAAEKTTSNQIFEQNKKDKAQQKIQEEKNKQFITSIQNKSILKRNTSQNGNQMQKQQNRTLIRHDTIDEQQSSDKAAENIRKSKSSNSTDKKVSFDSSNGNRQINLIEQNSQEPGSFGIQQKRMDSKKTQRKGHESKRKQSKNSISSQKHNKKIQTGEQQEQQKQNSSQQSFERSTIRYKSQYVQGDEKQYKINLLSNRNNFQIEPKNQGITSKRNHASMMLNKMPIKSQRNKSFISAASNDQVLNKPFRNTPDIIEKIYGQRLNNRDPSIHSIKGGRSKVNKQFSQRKSTHQYDVNDETKQQTKKSQRSNKKRSLSKKQSSKNLLFQNDNRISLRKQSHRFSKFKPKKLNSFESQTNSDLLQERSIKSKKSKKSEKSKKCKQQGNIIAEYSQEDKKNCGNQIKNDLKSSKIAKKFDSQKKIKQKKKAKLKNSKKSLRQYALQLNLDPIDNVGTNRAQNSSQNYQKAKMISIGIQKDQMNQKQIQTEDTKYFQTHEVFQNIQNKKKQFYLQKKQKIQKQFSKMTFQKKDNQNEPEIFEGQQIENSIDRALILKQIYGEQLNREKLKYPDAINRNRTIDLQKPQQRLLNSNFLWNSISKIQSLKNAELFNKKGISANLIKSKRQDCSSFKKVVKMLAQRNQFLIIRLFENITDRNSGFFGVWICDHYRWRCIIVNDLIPVGQDSMPIFSHHQGNQIWSSILQKALTVVLGGYQKLAQTSTNKIFHMLTGSNFINFRVREQFQKNKKLLNFLSQNQKKNFIIHAQKFSNCLQQHQQLQRQARIYYILGQKVINGIFINNSDGQVLLRMKQQDKEPFLIKLQKFACQFKNVQILQLRSNHNFTCMIVPESSDQSNISVFQLFFQEPQFGSITLSNPELSSLKTYLYKQEQQNVLRIVGQARQKNKQQVFFDCFFQEGKYYVFVESNKKGNLISYFGQGTPKLSLKQKIKQQGLKNDFTEYVPLHANSKIGKQTMPKFISFNKQNMQQTHTKSFSHFGNSRMRVKQGRDKALQDLRIHFVQFLLGTRN